MDFDLTQEQEDFRQAVREFAQEVVAPRAEEMDERHELPMDIVKQMGELGLFGLPFPEEYGGQGADFMSFCIAVEELARVDSSIAITLEAAVGLGANPIYANGTEEQKHRWLVPMARGEILGSFGLRSEERRVGKERGCRWAAGPVKRNGMRRRRRGG